MKRVFGLLAASDWLLMSVALGLGAAVGAAPADAPQRTALLERHFLLGLGAMLFTCFVHVLAFTYFVVFARLAQDAVAAAGMNRSRLREAVRLKQLSLRWLLLGVGTLIAAGMTGALASGPWRASPAWHLCLAEIAWIANTAAFVAEWGLIAKNVDRTQRWYAELPPAAPDPTAAHRRETGSLPDV